MRDRVFSRLVKNVAKKLNKDPRVVEYIVRQQFRFIAKDIIANPNANESYRAYHFGVFTPKTTKKKEDIKQRGVRDLQPKM